MFYVWETMSSKKDCRQGIPRNNFFSIDNSNRRPQTSEICRKYVKGWHWINEGRTTWGRQGKPLPLRNDLVGLSQTPMSNLVQSFTVSIGETPSKSN